MNKLILDYLKTDGESWPSSIYGERFRCSASLSDETFLPCVMLSKSDNMTELALRRFEDEKKGKGIFTFNSGDSYKKIVKHFVTSGNRLNHYDILKLEPTKYAPPLSLLKQIEGETTMAWTGWVFEMRNKKLFAYGTSFSMEFFGLPDSYTFDDVVAVHNHSYVSPTGELRSLTRGMCAQPEDYDKSLVYREKPYFNCFYDL